MRRTSPASGYLELVESELARAKNDSQLFDAIVNAPFKDKWNSTQLGLGFLSFVLVNKKNMTVDRTSISNTEAAKGAINITVKPYHELIVPLSAHNNYVVEAIKTGQPKQTNDWCKLLTPALKPEEARLNQAGAGIATSFVYPLGARDGAAIIYQYFIPLSKITNEHKDFMSRYAHLISQALKARS